MNTIVKAAAVQISPVLYSRQGTLAKIVAKIRELGEHDVTNAIFAATGRSVRKLPVDADRLWQHG